MEMLRVMEYQVIDREGTWTSIWAVYQKERVVTVEFTRHQSGLTDRIDLLEKAS